MAEPDAHPNGDQEVAGSIPAGSGNIFLVEIDNEILLYGHALPSVFFKKDRF